MNFWAFVAIGFIVSAVSAKPSRNLSGGSKSKSRSKKGSKYPSLLSISDCEDNAIIVDNTVATPSAFGDESACVSNDDDQLICQPYDQVSFSAKEGTTVVTPLTSESCHFRFTCVAAGSVVEGTDSRFVSGELDSTEPEMFTCADASPPPAPSSGDSTIPTPTPTSPDSFAVRPDPYVISYFFVGDVDNPSSDDIAELTEVTHSFLADYFEDKYAQTSIILLDHFLTFLVSSDGGSRPIECVFKSVGRFNPRSIFYPPRSEIAEEIKIAFTESDSMTEYLDRLAEDLPDGNTFKMVVGMSYDETTIEN